MPIDAEVARQLKEAMRARDRERVTALRNIRAALLEQLKTQGGREQLPDDEAEATLRRLAKQRRDSIESYEEVGRTDVAAAERAELAVIDTFLPKLADEATTRLWVREAIARSGASGPNEIGKVMGKLMADHRGEIDGSLANRIAREELSG